MRDPDCIFCKILSGEIPGNFVYQDDLVSAFHDINPIAPVHILIIPNAFTEEDEPVAGRMFKVVRQLAEELKISQSGYR